MSFAETIPESLTSLRLLLSIVSAYSVIWNVSADGECREIVKFHEDRWHGTLFMFGTIHFPFANKTAAELYFSLVGVKEDNRTYKISR